MSGPTKLQRWLDIIAFLVGRSLPVSIEDVMLNVPSYRDRWRSGDDTQRASARRGFERDKDELRSLGIPIRTVQYYTPDHPDVLEGYLIERRDFYLPYLKLVSGMSGRRDYPDRHRPANVEIAEADAPLALEALRRVAAVPSFPLAREARSAFRKLAFDLDPRAFSEGSPVLFMDAPGSIELSTTLRTLTDALLARKQLTFGYRGMYRGGATSREVDGYGLLFQSGHWYLVGHDRTRSDTRVFRVARMYDLAVNAKRPGTPDYEIPADFALDDYAGRQAWELGENDEAPVIARVQFPFPISLWVERNGHGRLDARGTDGAQVRMFELHQVEPFLRWLLGLDADVQVLDPPELRQEG